DGDDLIFVHQGSGRLETLFGSLSYGPGDYLVIPRGTIYRVVPEELGNRQSAIGNRIAGGQQEPWTRFLVVESASAIEAPKRYRNEYGQMLEHAPYCERDIRPPAEMEAHHETGDFVVEVKKGGRLTAYHY